MNLNINLPINSVSFGDVGWNLMLELYKKDIHPNFFPIGNNLDITAFDKTQQDFVSYLTLCAQKAIKRYKREYPCFRTWHIQGSEQSFSNDNYFFTFRELDQISEIERNILNNQKIVFVSCQETKEMFEEYGVTSKVVYCPLGFDNSHFYRKDKRYFNDGRISGLICAKFEERKATKRIIQLFLSKYKNNRNIHLILAITNVHFKPEDMNSIYNDIFGGQQPPFNVTILPYLRTRSELNDLYNSCDFIIDGSYYETWSLPTFTACAIGKHVLAHNVAGIKGWANNENSVLFEPFSKEIAHDGIFFHKDRNDFSFGNWYKWKDEDFMDGLEKVIKRVESNRLNSKGLELQKTFSWEKSINTILHEINT